MSEQAEIKEVFNLHAEIAQLKLLLADTFFSYKDVCLRKLISNSSNALNKIRDESLKESFMLDTGKELYINIIINKNDSTLTIIDTGIGMTKVDMINLGTIAKPRIKAFIEAYMVDNLFIVDQFNVGFYAAFLVADKVTVTSKHNDDEQFQWECSAGGSFTVKRDTDESLQRGTKIVLYIKKYQREYLKKRRIREIIKEYSRFIDYPIKLLVQKKREKELSNDKIEKDKKENNDEESKIEDKNKGKKRKIILKKYTEEEVLNSTKPIWIRNPNSIKGEEYGEFYKSLTNDWEIPLAVKHFSVIAGELKYKALLFIPSVAPSNLFDFKKKNNIRLYVRQVRIMDDYEKLLPEYLNFIKGIVDTDKLDSSRRKKNKILKTIRKHLLRECLEFFNELTADLEIYEQFYKQFGKNIKLGIREGDGNGERLAQFLRYPTSWSDTQMFSLKNYVSRMKDDQVYIYFITGENKEQVANSPFVERVIKCGYEVIFMIEPIDEYMIQQLKVFNNAPFMSVAKQDLELPETCEEIWRRNENKLKFATLCEVMKKILKNKVERVVISNRLIDSPCCIVSAKHGCSGNMERIIKAQILRETSVEGYMLAKKYLEINPDHVIIEDLREKVNFNEHDISIKQLVILLYEVALISSGFTLENPKSYADRIYGIIKLGFDLDDDELPKEMKNVADVSLKDEAYHNERMNEVD